jgi:hypothetical protein
MNQIIDLDQILGQVTEIGNSIQNSAVTLAQMFLKQQDLINRLQSINSIADDINALSQSVQVVQQDFDNSLAQLIQIDGVLNEFENTELKPLQTGYELANERYQVVSEMIEGIKTQITILQDFADITPTVREIFF